LVNNIIKHITSAPYHPATNGLAERAVQIVKKGLKKENGMYNGNTTGKGIDGLSNNSTKYHRCDTSRVTTRQTYQNKTGYLETPILCQRGRATTVPSEEWS